MELTEEQVRAAKACGCAFFPATEAQVQRLSQQRRIFRVAGKPFMLSRDGSFYETHGTLFRLIAEELEREPLEAAVEAAAPVSAPAPTLAAAPAPVAVPAPAPAAVAVTLPAPMPAEATAVLLAEPSAPDPIPVIETAPEAESVGLAEADDVLLDVAESEPMRIVRAAPALLERPVAQVRRRTAKPELPRWVTAGAERRGRLKPLRARLD